VTKLVYFGNLLNFPCFQRNLTQFKIYFLLF
jgi:hypothetical protein